MANIKVHVLDFHSIFTHIEIVLENTSTEPHTYYGINRWESPSACWSPHRFKSYIAQASSTFSFDITADPEDITSKWRKYWHKTEHKAGILTQNRGTAAQWFLTEFANIPKPSLSNLSWNHLALGVLWPSFIPSPVTLPGRIMANAKFYVNARNNPEEAAQHSQLFLYTSMAAATLLFATSVFTLTVAAACLSTGLAALAIAGSMGVAFASSYGFFQAYNALSAQQIYAESKKMDGEVPYEKEDMAEYSHPIVC